MRALMFRIARRLDRGLLPVMGPAQLGAGRREAAARVSGGCPLCGAAMSRHAVHRSPDQTHATRLTCPS